MRLRHRFGCATLVGVLVLGGACVRTLETGTAKTPDMHKPDVDGTCPSAQTACGVGAFAGCVDLQTDPTNCGACAQACSPGIACLAGVCQQTACVESASPFAGQPTASPTNHDPIHRQLLADVNGDGHLDLIEWLVYYPNPLHTFRVSLGQADGGFSTPDTYDTDFVVVDIDATDDNHDASTDLFVFGETSLVDGGSRLAVWLGSPDGHLTRARANDLIGAVLDGRRSIATDVSGDGWADVVTPSAFVSDGDQHAIKVFLSDSTGALHLTQTYLVGGLNVSRILIRDWNGDGRPDLVVLTGIGLEILYNHGDGTFEQSVACPVVLTTFGAEDVVAEDFNHDGRIDLALNGNTIRVLLRQSECGFAPIDSYDVPLPKSVPPAMGDALAAGWVPLMRTADMNGDGQLDLVAIFSLQYSVPIIPGETTDDELGPSVDGGAYLSVFLGKPDGKFQRQDTIVSLGSAAFTDLAIGEGTGDQRPDVVTSTSDGQVGTWKNTCQ